MNKYELSSMAIKDALLQYMLDCCIRTGIVKSGILKGAVSLKISLGVNSEVSRMTSDLDFDILASIDPQSSLDKLSQEICKHPWFSERKRRINKSNPGMGIEFSVTNGDFDFILKIDFQRVLVDSTRPFRKSGLSEMLLDKVNVNLKGVLERRSKDAFDLYIIDNFLIGEGVRVDQILPLNMLSTNSFAECLYFSEDGYKRLQHAMSKYKPNPTTVPINCIIQSNISFLTGLFHALEGATIVKVSSGEWREVGVSEWNL